jgi:hypothetical protein
MTGILLSSCAGQPVAPPSKIIEVPVHVPQPAACKRLRAVTLPAGSTAQDVIETQARVILEYESQIISCSKP